MMRRMIVVMAACVLGAAAPQPATLGPAVTGSMYNGNNVNPPTLPKTQGQVTGAVAQNGVPTTGAHIQGGQGAAHGGGG